MAITGLVLQGGGALGAFELGVVECLLDNGIRPDVVSGVSIGAINATVLCGCRHSDPKSALRELWADLTTFSFPLQWAANMNQKMSMFGNPGMYRPRTDYFNIMGWTSFYDTAPLDQTLARNVDFKKLGPANFKLKPKDQAPRLILTATNLLTGRLERFDSKDMQIEAAHVRASGSLPPSFPRLQRRRRTTALNSCTGMAVCSTTRPCPRSLTPWRTAMTWTRPCTSSTCSPMPPRCRTTFPPW